MNDDLKKILIEIKNDGKYDSGKFDEFSLWLDTLLIEDSELINLKEVKK